MNRLVKYVGPVLIALLTLFALAACGGSNVPANTPAPTNTAATNGGGDDAEPTNTRAPRATRTTAAEPTDTREARATNTRVARATNTPEADDSADDGGDIPADWETYESSAGAWSISYPSDWTVNDATDPNVQFLSPTNDAFVQVTYADVGGELDPEQLVDLASTQLGGSFPGYEETGREEQPDGSTRLDFTFEQQGTALDGRVFIEQRGTGLYMLMFVTEADATADYQETFEQILASYVTPRGDAAGPTEEAEEPEATATTESSDRETPTPGDSGSTGETLAVGEAGESGDLTITLNSVRRSASGLLSPDEGNEYLIVNLTVVNNTAEEQIVSSLLNFSVENPGGQEPSQSFATGVETPLDGNVPANGELTGEIGYEVPEGATGLVLVFDPIFGGSELRWSLDD